MGRIPCTSIRIRTKQIFRYLNLDKLGHQVALIINADSKKMGKKDIIKIENIEKINYTVLGLLSPGITINEVRNEVIVSKIKPELPEQIQDILICENPNCITSQEKYIPHNFTLVDREKGSYKCEYCEQILNPSEV